MTVRRALAAVALLAAPAAAADPVEFNRDIRPILSDNCFFCHGPDKSHRKAKLRLDVREAAVEHGALVPGKADESELVSRVFETDETLVMPPPDSHKKLTAKQKDLLKRWVGQGAVYQPHWAYITPTRPAVPAVMMANWVRNPVDAFVLAELEKRKLAPSPEADKRTLIRRLTLDLIGLPPTPEEVEAYVSDPSPNAYEKFVDRLLASPHYGERMTVPWLDLVRYADTVGFHGDQNQNVFPYRDYVIDSFNANKPFDQFTREQLAGDLLPKPTPEQLTATCFNRLNMMTREGGAQPKEYLAKYQADRVRTVSMTWLGSTLGCAECHDHKFDPFTQKDFYSLGSFFADVRQWGVYSDYKYTPNPDLKGWTNDHPFPPEIEVDSPYLTRRLAKLRDQLRSVSEEAIDADASFGSVGRAFLAAHSDGWAVPPTEPEAQDSEIESDGKVVFAGKVAKGGSRVLTLRPPPGRVAAIRLELFPHKDHTGFLARDESESVEIATVAVAVKKQGKKATPIRLGFGEADGRKVRFSSTVPVLGLAGGAWTTDPNRPKTATAAAWMLDDPVRLADGDELIITIKSDDVGCARVSISPLVGIHPLRPADGLAQEPVGSPAWVAAYFLASGTEGAETFVRDVAECYDGKHPVQVTVPLAKPLTTRVLPRGNWMDETGPVVQPAVPGFLPQPKADRRLTRLDLADWLTSKDNPLTARVFVNRLWKQFFGTGLSGVLEDVGAQGEAPSHPELLDWLAAEFRDGWDVKKAVKTLVMSAAYRQDSKARPELKDLDPNNRLVAFQTPRRLDAEFVRDNALAVSGLLNREIGGPSAKPYQPAGYYANLQFPDRDYVAQKDDRQYRRGVYAHWQRTFLQPMLANFDAPGREECTANRIPANSPQQALTLLNDPTFVEAARVLAAAVMAGDGSAAERIDRLYRKVLARPAKPAEQAALGPLLRDQRSYYAQHPDDAQKLSRIGLAPVAAGVPLPELAAWTQVCRAVLNLHETITRY